MVPNAYKPRTLNIKVGTEVTWSNAACKGGCTVTFYSAGISLDSGPMAIGATFKHTFGDAGVFAFHCQPAPNHRACDPGIMRGLITVTN